MFLSIAIAVMSLHAASLTVTANMDEVTGSLREMVESATAGDTVVFNLPDNDTVVVSATITISKNIVIEGRNISSNKRCIVRQSSKSRILSVQGLKVVLKDLIIMNGESTKGAILYVSGKNSDLLIDKCLFSGGKCTLNGGGAIYIDSGNILITNSVFANNIAESSNGGAIFNNLGNLTMLNDSLYGNCSSKYSSGGAIYNFHGSCAISHCTILHNHTDEGQGGGIYNGNGVISIDTSEISFNSSKSSGGGIYNSEGYCSINASTIAYDSANFIEEHKELPTFTPSGEYDIYGGGIFNDAGIVFIQSSTIEGNLVQAGARDIYNPGNYLDDYTYSAFGGGIYNETGRVFVLNSTIADNVSSTVGTSGSSIVGITCISRGAGIYNNTGHLTLQNSTITLNSYKNSVSTYRWSDRHIESSGEGVFTFFKNCFILNSIILGNTSADYSDFFDHLTGSRGVNSIFRKTEPSIRQGCQNVTDLNLVFGPGDTTLVDNGGPTKTIYPSATLSKAFAAGVRSALGRRDTIINSWPVKIPLGIYFKQDEAYSVETDSIIAPGTFLEVIAVDQRGIPRKSPPCIGAVEFESANAIADLPSNYKPLFFNIAINNYHLSILSANGLPELTEVFNLSGRRVYLEAITTRQKNSCITLPRYLKGVHVIRVTSGGKSIQRKVLIR